MHNKVTDATALVGALTASSAVSAGSLTLTESDGLTLADVTQKTILAFSVGTTVAAGTTGTETASTYDLPDQAVVYDVFINVTTASTATTKTVDIGILSTSSGGDVDGFLDGASTSSTGIKRGLSSKLGAYLTATAGTTDAAAQRITFPTDGITAKSMSYQSGSTGDGEGLTFDVYVTLAKLE